ncbi:hypothetical protein QTO34_019617 [Cnephaeus nilssonii]|uniref:Uncharacterized protein n=1 Tax=Cnephaeus nilssonii TaxID=3371016 RepID=A0AA40HX95_CNENI|nr:hypothetical protein QTO34_019617 [Eptesicus nilssonii]
MRHTWKAGAVALGSSGGNPRLADARQCRLRAGSVRSCTRTTSCLSRIAGLLGLPLMSQQKHWTGQKPAHPAQRPARRRTPQAAILAPSEVRQPCGVRFHKPPHSVLIG